MAPTRGQIVQGFHQGIGIARGGVAAPEPLQHGDLLEMSLGLIQVSLPSVTHGQQVVDAVGFRLQRQRGLEVADGFLGIPS